MTEENKQINIQKLHQKLTSEHCDFLLQIFLCWFRFVLILNHIVSFSYRSCGCFSFFIMLLLVWYILILDIVWFSWILYYIVFFVYRNIAILCAVSRPNFAHVRRCETIVIVERKSSTKKIESNRENIDEMKK